MLQFDASPEDMVDELRASFSGDGYAPYSIEGVPEADIGLGLGVELTVQQRSCRFQVYLHSEVNGCD